MTTSSTSPKRRKITKSINHEEINEFMKATAKEMDYHFTHACMLRMVKLQFGCGSYWLLEKIFEEFNWSKVLLI
jgi:hypothetical protein